jgi:hypothetical protein
VACWRKLNLVAIFNLQNFGVKNANENAFPNLMDFANYFEMGFAFQMTGKVIMRFKISVTSQIILDAAPQ